MKAMIHQPNYLPWRGWFEKARRADVLVLLDTVAFTRGGYTNRTRIRSTSEKGWSWLTVPIQQFHGQRIIGVQIDGHSWRRKHVAALEQMYGSSPLWAGLGREMAAVLTTRHTQRLVKQNTYLLLMLLSALEIGVRVVPASVLGAQGTGTALLVDICQRVGAGVYLAGGGAPGYLNYALMESSGIEVESATYKADRDPPLTVLDDYFRGEWT